jgi:quinol monooxygenase YgiN
MLCIVVKFSIRPDVADQWLARVAPFTAATRAEPGNVFFEWARSVEKPNQFVLLEAFRDHLKLVMMPPQNDLQRLG